MFSRKMMEFLIENSMRDDKIWYKENKEVYLEYVVKPMAEFVSEIAATMLEIDPLFVVEPKVDKTISRVYRDTRFSKDKTVFRDRVWCAFKRNKGLYHGLPGFFFEIMPEGFRYGCGYYEASTAAMKKMREMIMDNDPGFKRAQKAFDNQDIFIIEGDMYKRSKAPLAGEKDRNWIDRKSICFTHNSFDNELLYSNKIASKVAEDFLKLKSVYEFLCKTNEI